MVEGAVRHPRVRRTRQIEVASNRAQQQFARDTLESRHVVSGSEQSTLKMSAYLVKVSLQLRLASRKDWRPATGR
jgi:hypothetical protein